MTPLKSMTKPPPDFSRARILLLVKIKIIGLHCLMVSHVKSSINYRCLHIYFSVTERYIGPVD